MELHDEALRHSLFDASRSASPTMLDAALSFARCGLPVFPCTLNRNPIIAKADGGNGFYDATTDEKQIRQWWTRWPNASIGMRTGSTSGRLVLDVDPRNGGDKSLAVLLETYGQLPETLCVATGRGGTHYYFQALGLSISSGELSPGIDIKAEGGYVILPPSPHPSGKAYEWANKSEVSDLPLWLEEMLLERRNGKATPPPVLQGEIKTGGRDNWLTSQAGSYARRGDSVASIFEKLRIDYSERCEQTPPITDKDFKRIAKSVWNKEQRRREKEPEAQPSGPPRADIPTLTATEPEPIILGREDTSNAVRFVRDHHHLVRYWFIGKDGKRGRWLRCEVTHWGDDADGRVWEFAKQTARNIYLECAAANKEEADEMAKWARRSMNSDKIAAMLKLAQSDPRMRITSDMLDANPWLVNFMSGTVDAPESNGNTAKRITSRRW
jgi:Bifunctional DNA primase/polymerase, N-terminal/D5 N terminal like/Primase C terminal 1 (PriCT-1)